MSTEQRPDETSASPPDEAKESTSPDTKAASEPAHVHPQDAPTQPELASDSDVPKNTPPPAVIHAAGAGDHAGHTGEPGEAGDDESGDDGDAEGEGSDAVGEGGDAGAAGSSEAGGASPTGEKKKRRRRRRKKKTGVVGADGAVAGAPGVNGEGGEPALNADGTPVEAAAAAAGEEGGDKNRRPERGERKRKEHRPHEERERPAFNHGDVVFGKVLEFTEDVIFIDLSGKAKAIFDLRELLITEEDDAAPVPEEEDDEPEGAHADAGASGDAPAGGDAHAGADANANAGAEANASADANAGAGADANADAHAVEAAPDAVTTEVQVPERAPVAAPPEKRPDPPPQPQLPRVILEPGAPFVGVVHNDGGRGGLVVLTHHPKRASRAKPVVSAAFRDKTLVWGIITGVIKGGVELDVDGLRAFAPGSHMDLRMGADLHPLIGKRLPFAVTQYGKRGHNIVLSRRSMLEEHAKEQREEALKNLKIGSVVEGTVRTVVQFGAFVDVGGVEGLVPLSEMSHNRSDTPKDIFKVGDKVDVKILRVDEKGKLWLSRRSAVADPWSAVAEKYQTGSKHTGKVARLQPFGAFIELEPGVDGLIHTADLSIKRIEHPSEVVKVGDPIDVVVNSLDPSHHRIGLHPAPSGEATGETPQRVQVHKVVKVAIVAIEPNGLVVRVLGATGRNARGFITAAGTGSPKGAELRKLFPVGKELDAKITEIDPRRGDMRLSIKAVNEDNERNAFQQYRAQVKREAKFGTFADLLKKVNVPKE